MASAAVVIMFTRWSWEVPRSHQPQAVRQQLDGMIINHVDDLNERAEKLLKELGFAGSLERNLSTAENESRSVLTIALLWI